MNAKLEVINAMAGHGHWLEKVQEEMGHGKEILLLLAPTDQTKTNALAKLCSAYHYAQCADFPPEIWAEYQRMLDLNDFAAKEHGIGPELIFLLHPQGGGAQSKQAL